MPACKKTVLTLLLLLSASFTAFSQNSAADDGLSMPAMPSMPKMPQMSSSLDMPSLSMPAAPTAPVLSSSSDGFYVPGFQNGTSAKNSSSAAEGESKNQEPSENTVEKKDGQASSPSSSASAKTLAESLAKNNLLSAGDISSLYDSGLFTSLTSLSPSSDSNSTEILLQRILENLEELKNSQTGVSPEKKQELANLQHDSKLFKSREPKILRFKINGYNITDSVSQSFFSEAEADGSFLFTGDRSYYVSGRERTETFYILFKAIRSNGSAVTFEVTPGIIQDSENPNSFLYRFCQKKGMRAEKTGNLVSLHFSEDDLKVDLLLDIDIKK